MNQKIGITLSGGGARGAYQAGVLESIYEITQMKKSPFRVISGVSAGALNAMALASHTEDFQLATELISETWLNLEMHKIFKTDLMTALQTALKWTADLTLGNFLPTRRVTHLLDTTPLRELLIERMEIVNIHRNLQSGALHGVALSATDYRSGKCVTFFDGDSGICEWNRSSGMGKRTVLNVDHMMASSAIPIFFPPVRIDHSDYGDGGIGQNSPLSPVLRLGAERILAIGLEHPPGNEKADCVQSSSPLTLGDIAGTLMNTLFIKSMRGDIIRLKQTNKLLSLLSPEEMVAGSLTMKQVPALFITPSIDLGKIDMDQLKKFPFALRLLLKNTGLTDRRAWDILSYLAFDHDYAKALIDIGRKDGLALAKEIEAFIDT